MVNVIDARNAEYIMAYLNGQRVMSKVVNAVDIPINWEEVKCITDFDNSECEYEYKITRQVLNRMGYQFSIPLTANEVYSSTLPDDTPVYLVSINGENGKCSLRAAKNVKEVNMNQGFYYHFDEEAARLHREALIKFHNPEIAR